MRLTKYDYVENEGSSCNIYRHFRSDTSWQRREKQLAPLMIKSRRIRSAYVNSINQIGFADARLHVLGRALAAAGNISLACRLFRYHPQDNDWWFDNRRHSRRLSSRISATFPLRFALIAEDWPLCSCSYRICWKFRRHWNGIDIACVDMKWRPRFW